MEDSGGTVISIFYPQSSILSLSRGLAAMAFVWEIGASENRMKLNFWQMLGLVLLVIGVGWYIVREMNEKKAKNPNPTPPTTATTQWK